MTLADKVIYDAERRKGNGNLTNILENLTKACLLITPDHCEFNRSINGYARNGVIQIHPYISPRLKELRREEEFYSAHSNDVIVLRGDDVLVCPFSFRDERQYERASSVGLFSTSSNP